MWMQVVALAQLPQSLKINIFYNLFFIPHGPFGPVGSKFFQEKLILQYFSEFSPL